MYGCDASLSRSRGSVGDDWTTCDVTEGSVPRCHCVMYDLKAPVSTDDNDCDIWIILIITGAWCCWCCCCCCQRRVSLPVLPASQPGKQYVVIAIACYGRAYKIVLVLCRSPSNRHHLGCVINITRQCYNLVKLDIVNCSGVYFSGGTDRSVLYVIGLLGQRGSLIALALYSCRVTTSLNNLEMSRNWPKKWGNSQWKKCYQRNCLLFVNTRDNTSVWRSI